MGWGTCIKLFEACKEACKKHFPDYLTTVIIELKWKNKSRNLSLRPLKKMLIKFGF